VDAEALLQEKDIIISDVRDLCGRKRHPARVTHTELDKVIGNGLCQGLAQRTNIPVVPHDNRLPFDEPVL
jgi:hypothetical protein